MSITLSHSAAARVKIFLKKYGEKHGLLRIGVRFSGCSGMMYTLNLIDKPLIGDTVIEDKGVKIAIDIESLKFLDGIKLDFVRSGLNEGFKFNNPNIKDTCGCGKSFNV